MSEETGAEVRPVITIPREARMPDGWMAVDACVYVNPNGDLVITGAPDDVWPGYSACDDEHPHNCDAEGCGWEHVIGRGKRC